MPARFRDSQMHDAAWPLEFSFNTGDTGTRVLFLVHCTYGCCISTCTVVNFPCEYGNMLWKTRRFNMQLMDDACSWCRWPCSMRGLPRLLSTSWATENAVLALFLDPLLLADGFSTPHTTLGGCQVHCVPAHGGRVQKLATWRFPQMDRSSSVSQFRCLTVYLYQNTP